MGPEILKYYKEITDKYLYSIFMEKSFFLSMIPNKINFIKTSNLIWERVILYKVKDNWEIGKYMWNIYGREILSQNMKYFHQSLR